MPFDTPIARTQFYRPQLPVDYLERTRVLNKLDSRDHPALILVTAPAGFGKSMLLSHWLSTNCLNYSWYSLSAHDNNLHRFINYCVRSVQQNFKTFGSALLVLCSAPRMPDLGLISDFLDEEITTLKAPFYLVLDDYHVINNPDIHQLVIKLCSMNYQNFHMIISSRRDPTFPIGEWRSKNMVIDIRSSDLQFSKEESRTFLMNAGSNFQGEDFTNEIDEAFGGWVAGLRLFILAAEMPHHADPTDPEGENRIFAGVNQLIHSILDQQIPKHQEFLLRLSMVEEFNQELFNVLCLGSETKGGAAGQLFEHFMDACFSSNMFIRALDDKHNWYSFHQLFRELLFRKWTVEAGENLISEQHLKAGLWYEKWGMNTKAIQYFLKRNHSDHALRVFKMIRKELLTSGNWHSLDYIFILFSDQMVKSHPVLLLTKAWLLVFKDKVSAVVKLLKLLKDLIATASLDPEERSQFKGEFSILKAYDHYLFQGDMLKCVECCDEAFKHLDNSNPNLIGFAWIFYGGAMQSQKKAHVAKEKILIQYQSTENVVLQAQLLLIICFMDWFEGDLMQVEQTAHNLIQLGTASGHSMALVHGYYFAGLACYRMNRIKESLNKLELALPLRHYALQVNNLGVTDTLARVYEELGQNSLAQKMVLQNHRDSLEYGGEEARRCAQALEADINWQTQNQKSGYRWATETDYSQILPIISYSIPACSQAKILVSDSQASSWSKALLICKELLPILVERNNRNYLARVLAMEALALYKLGDRERSDKSLSTAIELAERGDHAKVFYVAGEKMIEMLRLYSKANPQKDYVKQLITGISTSLRKGHDDSVTSREVQILKLLDENLTNKEIGEKLFISETTVKKHITNLNRKLDTHSRIGALRRAKDLALL